MTALERSSAGAVFPDALGKRLRWALLASVAINLLIWRVVAAVARHPAVITPPPIEVTRVIVTPGRRPVVKTVTKQEIKRHVEKARKVVLPPPPRPHPQPRRTPPPPPPPARQPPPKPVRMAQAPPPEGAHN